MPFISAAVGAIGAAIGLGSVGIGLASAAAGIGLNFVAAKIQQSRAKKASKQASGTQFEKEYGENVSRKAVCGLVGMAGHDIYVNTYGRSNKFLEQVYVFSDYPCDGLSKIWAGGKLLQIATEDGKNYTVTSGDYAGRMSFVFYDGTQTAPDDGLVDNSNPLGRWDDDNVGSGICYLIARMTYNQEKLSQFPEFFFEIRGARLYDPRKDSTVGGSGTHRWGQYSTHEFSENPIVQEYTYRRGFSWNGDLFLGMDMDASDLPLDRVFTAMNICDEIVDGEPRYRCSIILDADVDHGDNIDAIMTSCGGIVIDSVEGSWPLIGSVQPIVETFTDDDLITTEPVRFQRRRSMAELTNSVSGTYLDPGNLWSPVGYDTQTNPSQVAIDRRTRDVQINFDTVRSKRQANQLASIYYNENRYEATADLVLRPRFQTIKVGDWVRWNSARYGNRVYMVQSRSIQALSSDGPRNVVLSLQERDAAIYAKAGLVAPVVPIPNGEAVYLNELQDWAVIPVIGSGADGRAYPAFRSSWAAIDDVTVRSISFEWWIATEPANKFRRQIEPDETIAFFQEGILGLTDYVFRHKLIADRTTNWSAPITVKSLDAGMDDITVGLGQVRDDIRNRFEELQAQQDEFWQRIEDITTSFSLEGGVGQIDRQTIRAEVGKAFAEISQERRVRITDQEALAQQITVISAGIAGALARITTEETARATADTALTTQITSANSSIDGAVSRIATEETTRASADEALSSSITGVSSDLNGKFANGLVEFRSVSAPDGVNVRFAVMLRAGTSAAFRESGFFIELYTQGGSVRSRMAVQADQFVVDNGGGTSVYPLVFEGGALKLQVANIGTVNAGLITSPNGKMQINIAAGTIVIRS